MRLHVCVGCERHIRESLCPFCGATNQAAAPKAIKIPTRGLTRAAVVLGSALAVAGCGDDDDPTPGTDAGVADAQATDAQAMDAPASDAPIGSDATVLPDATAEDAPLAIDAAYGGPPIDSGVEADAGPAQDAGTDGAIVAAYGAPPSE